MSSGRCPSAPTAGRPHPGDRDGQPTAALEHTLRGGLTVGRASDDAHALPTPSVNAVNNP